MATPVLANLDFTSHARVVNALDPTSAQDYATKAYVDANDGIPWGRPKRSGQDNYVVPGFESITSGTGPQWKNKDRIFYEPIVVAHQITVDAIVFETAGDALGAVRVGIYNADTSFHPTTLVIDGGSTTVTTGTRYIVTFTATVLPRGLYLLAHNQQNDGALRYQRQPLWVQSFGQNSNPYLVELYATQSYAALPSTGTDWTAESYDYNGFQRALALRISAIS